MKVIILAAGEGKRLRPLTNDIPKCMVKYKNKPLISYTLETIYKNNIKDISIVAGYKSDVLQTYLKDYDIKFYKNEKYDASNMVSSLFCALEEFNDDLIISYSDIIYNEDILKKLILSDDNIGVVVDKSWRELWNQRMDNPLDDAETLKVKNGKIIELGKKANDYTEIEGQYIGLIKFSKQSLKEIISLYQSLDKNLIYDGKDFDNMYLTSFIQLLIDNNIKISPIYIDGGWIEIDCKSDLDTKIVNSK